MDDIENRLREMNERIDRQEKEAKARQGNTGKNTDGRSATANNKPSGKQKQYKPPNKEKFGGRQFQNKPAARKYDDGKSGANPVVGCMFEEIQVTRRIYQPSGDPRSHFSKPLAPAATGFASTSTGFGGFDNFGPNMFQNNYSPHNRDTQRPDFSARKQPPKAAVNRNEIIDDPKVIELRHNHQPFIIAKAFNTRSCVACHRPIGRNSVFVMHKEIEVYRHPECHWKMVYSEDFKHKFYHLDRACLDMRGFDRDYLDLLCEVVVNKDVPASAEGAIKKCGLYRPMANNELSLDTLKASVGLSDLKIGNDDGERTENMSCKDGCDESRSDREISDGTALGKDEEKSLQISKKFENTKIDFANDSDDDFDKL